MTDTETISVVLADDQQLLRAGFNLVLGAEPDITIVGEADDGVEALELVHAKQPDIVLMDIRMPRKDGVTATADIIASKVSTRVLVLTTFDYDDYVIGALRAGASGFLTKDARPDDLIQALRTVHHGGSVVSPHILSGLLGRLSETERHQLAANDNNLTSLTSREREVLVHIAQGLTNAEIAQRLVVSETTVKTHVGHILAKLEARDRVQAVIIAYESGLVQPGR
ncbi:response regulator [Haloglycomyces albus]|uniref:response regulator n=1 Tax=Haloglycomyces albus TaxID=526067 RepID=UPI00046D91B7|nr:response regulator transcription factor [Haloglycomyces albus]